MEDIKSFVREARKRKGITIKELSGLCGLADSNLRSIEKGEHEPVYRTLEKIINALGYGITFNKGEEKITGMRFPEFMKAKRKEQKIKQKDIAKKIMVPASLISSYEKEKMSCGWYNLNKITEALGYKVGFEKVEG